MQLSSVPTDGEPYCSACGYQLTGLVDSSKCPECGRPIVEVLTRGPGWLPRGRRYTSPIRIFGLPLLQIALGPHGRQMRGRARAVIAIGDLAVGWLAIGGLAFGGIAVGGLAVGLIGLGGLGVGLLAGMGGGGVGGLAAGGGAIGVVAQGGGAVGVLADGGGAYGYFARGGGAWGRHVIVPGAVPSPQAQQLLSRWQWLVGPQPGGHRILAWCAAATAATALLGLLIGATGYLVSPTRGGTGSATDRQSGDQSVER